MGRPRCATAAYVNMTCYGERGPGDNLRLPRLATPC